MRKSATLKLKKGGMDTIIAYIVVMIPLLYVLVYMVATIYHFAVQQYMNQVVKEACVMISTYGAVTQGHEEYIKNKLSKSAGECEIKYYKREFDNNKGTVGKINKGPSDGGYGINDAIENDFVKKADIIGILVKSTDQSVLGTVSSFNLFGAKEDDINLYYTSYREEIIRNAKPGT